MVIFMKKNIIIIGLLCTLIDQISKIIIISSCTLGEVNDIIHSFFSISYIKNYGAAWGIFSDSTILLAIISIIFLIFSLKYVNDKEKINKIEMVSYGLLLGGIVGNLIDRIFRGHVVDFLSFNIFGYDFPVFNIADSFIVIGIIIILFMTFLESKGTNNDSK